MNRLSHVALLPLLFFALTACASSGASGTEEASEPTVFVQVDNSARADVDVSILRGGQELRLGRVQMGDQRRFRVPSAILLSSPYSFTVKVVARDGTGTYVSPSLIVSAGQNVYIEAQPSLANSQYTVR